MKKILLAALAVGLMSTSAIAVDGKITQIKVQSDNTIVVYLTDTSNILSIQKLVGTPEAIKSMYAAVLTAKSTNADVGLSQGTADNGTGWANVFIK